MGKVTKAVATRPTTSVKPGKPVDIQPVGLVEQTALPEEALKNLPPEFRQGEQIAGFPPQPTWERAGQALWGTFLNMREGVGPNTSRLYEIAAETGAEHPLLVSVWGTTVLDRQMDMAFAKGLKSGDKIAIVYLGPAQNAKPGQNPPHLFAIRILLGGKK